MARTRDILLEEAGDLINKQRETDYGEASKNFQDIATGWSIILGTTVDLEDVALMMAWLKIARLFKSPNHRDSWLDLIGYAALGGELSER
jgi:hypothetical protein